MLSACWRSVPCCFNDTVFHDGFWESQRSLCAIVLSKSGFVPISLNNIFYDRRLYKLPSCHFLVTDWSNSFGVASYLRPNSGALYKQPKSQCLCRSFFFLFFFSREYFDARPKLLRVLVIVINFLCIFYYMYDSSRNARSQLHVLTRFLLLHVLLYLFSQSPTWTCKRHAIRWLNELWPPLSQKIDPFVYICFVLFIWYTRQWHHFNFWTIKKSIPYVDIWQHSLERCTFFKVTIDFFLVLSQYQGATFLYRVTCHKVPFVMFH